MAKISTSISIDAETKAQAQELFADLGLDLSTAINMFLRQAIRENGIPFSMKLEPKPESKGLQAMKEASRIAAENGIADLSLDEINAEIAAARGH